MCQGEPVRPGAARSQDRREAGPSGTSRLVDSSVTALTVPGLQQTVTAFPLGTWLKGLQLTVPAPKALHGRYWSGMYTPKGRPPSRDPGDSRGSGLSLRHDQFQSGPHVHQPELECPHPQSPKLAPPLPRLPGPNRMEALIGPSTATGHGGQGRRPGTAGPKPAGRRLLPAQAPALPGAPAHQSAVGPGTGPPPLCSRTLEVNQRLGRPRLQCTVVRKVLLAHLGKTMAVLWKCRARGRGSRVSWLR